MQGDGRDGVVDDLVEVEAGDGRAREQMPLDSDAEQLRHGEGERGDVGGAGKRFEPAEQSLLDASERGVVAERRTGQGTELRTDGFVFPKPQI